MDGESNKENLIINAKENGGNCEYNYDFFKKGFEEWIKDLDMSSPDINDLKIYLKECGYKMVEIIENCKKTR